MITVRDLKINKPHMFLMICRVHEFEDIDFNLDTDISTLLFDKDGTSNLQELESKAYMINNFPTKYNFNYPGRATNTFDIVKGVIESIVKA